MGRVALHGQPMTPAERQAKKRTSRLLLIELIRDDLQEARKLLPIDHPARLLVAAAVAKISEL